MAGILYYAPGLSGLLDLEQVQEMGLGHAFDETPFCRDVSTATPDGGRGVLLINRKRLGEDISPAMNMADQVWEQLPSTGQKLYGGYYRDLKPTPVDLACQQQLSGYQLTMADEQSWMVPLVRRFDESSEGSTTALPSNYRIDADGTLKPDAPLPRWKWLMEATEDAWHAMVDERDVTDQSMLITAGKIFSANYAVSHRELGLLRVLSQDIGPAGIVALACDYGTWSAWHEAKKKTDSQQATVGLNSAAGETEESSITSPLAQTS